MIDHVARSIRVRSARLPSATSPPRGGWKTRLPVTSLRFGACLLACKRNLPCCRKTQRERGRSGCIPEEKGLRRGARGTPSTRARSQRSRNRLLNSYSSFLAGRPSSCRWRRLGPPIFPILRRALVFCPRCRNAWSRPNDHPEASRTRAPLCAPPPTSLFSGASPPLYARTYAEP